MPQQCVGRGSPLANPWPNSDSRALRPRDSPKVRERWRSPFLMRRGNPAMRNACSRAADEFAADRRAVASALRAVRPAVAQPNASQAFLDEHVQDCRRCRAAYNGDFLCAIGEDLRRSGLNALRDAGDRARDAHWAILFRTVDPTGPPRNRDVACAA